MIMKLILLWGSFTCMCNIPSEMRSLYEKSGPLWKPFKKPLKNATAVFKCCTCWIIIMHGSLFSSDSQKTWTLSATIVSLLPFLYKCYSWNLKIDCIILGLNEFYGKTFTQSARLGMRFYPLETVQPLRWIVYIIIQTSSDTELPMLIPPPPVLPDRKSPAYRFPWDVGLAGGRFSPPYCDN